MLRMAFTLLFIVFVPLLAVADGCSSHTVLMPDGKMLMCTTCTYSGQSQTTCL